MTKGKSPITLVEMRELLLRIAVMVALVGLGGVSMKKGVVAQTMSSIVLTPEETQASHWLDKQFNHSNLANDLNDNSVQIGLPLVLAIISQRAKEATISLPGTFVDLWQGSARLVPLRAISLLHQDSRAPLPYSLGTEKDCSRHGQPATRGRTPVGL